MADPLPRRICFITLSRSDYASLRPVIRAARADSAIEAVVIAGGSHLLERFGRSIDGIREDGIEVDEAIDFLREQDNSEADFARAYGRAFAGLVDSFERWNPDAVFILGDRWEMLAVASAASLLRIPIVHHSGGDITQGSLDNQTRYALTVLAHQHLVAIDEHRERLLRLGEESWRVVCVGEPALTEIDTDSERDVYADLGLEAGKPFVLATYHPTTFEQLDFARQVECFIRVLDQVAAEIVLTAPNPDPGSNTVYQALADYARANPRVHLFENLGELYHAAMARAEYMIGNSSSGIWEAPSFGLPVINLGNRQQDRLRAENVIDAELDPAAAKAAIGRLDEIRSRAAVKARRNPYVRDDTLALILRALAPKQSREHLLAKVFVDPLRAP